MRILKNALKENVTEIRKVFMLQRKEMGKESKSVT